MLSNKFLKACFVFIIMIYAFDLLSQDNVGIGTTSPDPSAILDLTSTNKGFLPPRMNTSQRNLIASPVEGLVIYNTENDRYEYYNGSGWVSLLGITSVGLALPSELSVTNSPLTSNGTITATWANKNANIVFAGPSTGSPASPTFRALVSEDIPNLDASKINNGTFSVERGGTGASTITGVLKGDGTNAVTGISNTTGNITYWSDANTIGGVSKLSWDNTKSILAVDASIRLIPQATAPNSGAETEGQIYYNDVSNDIKYWNGTAWTSFGGSGSLPSGNTNQTLRYGASDWEATNVIRATTSQVAIGSGTFTPTSVIHSDAGDATAHYHKFTAGTTTGQTANDGFDIGVNDTGSAIINQREAKPIILSTNSTEKMRIMADGKVGIGTNSPSGQSLVHLNQNNTNAVVTKFTNSGNSNGTNLGIASDGTFEINNLESKPIKFFTNNVERLRIDSVTAGGIPQMLFNTSTISDTINVKFGGDVHITGDLVVDGNIDPIALILIPQNSPPNTAIEGTLYYDNNSNTIKSYNGSNWSDIGSSQTSNIELLNTDNTAKQLKFYEPSSSGTNFSAFKAQNQNNDITYTLPPTVGTTGQVLSAADNDGGMEWKTPASLPSLTQGSMLFSSGGTNILEDNSNLFWDDSNNRLGIGTNEPEASVHIVGDLIIGEGGTAINKVIRASATINSGNVGLQTYSTVKVTVIGARPNGHVIVNPRSLIHNNNLNQLIYIAYSFVSDDDEVSIVFGGTYSSLKNFTNKVFDILIIQ